MYRLARQLLFLFNPERAHHLTFSMLKIPRLSRLMRSTPVKDLRLERKLFGLNFPNPVGLAAGLDKDAVAFEKLGELGFGFVEIGTVTPLAQPGNPRPRLFRLKKDEALINRMGFNNKGAKAAAARLAKRNKNSKVIIGGNIGKNKNTPNESAEEDYVRCFEILFPHVDYFVVNVSSPNTPDLRSLQDKEPLTRLLTKLETLNGRQKQRKPILLKIAPDLNNSQLDDIISIVTETRIDGVIATNTTISRAGLSYTEAEMSAMGAGGLSGKPLRERSTEVIRYLKQKSGNVFPVIGVGGIHSAADAIEKFRAGADLVQLYTGFIYEGPALIGEINKALLTQTT